MFAGFYAIVASLSGEFTDAAIAIFVAMILDGVDGRVARMTNTQSAFGAEYDSLSDMVSFGLAPALIMYEWSLASFKALGPEWGKVGWLAAFFYMATAALRLARFNTKVGIADKRYFQGLPSPAAAAVVVGLVWVADDLGIEGESLQILSLLTITIVGALMVSNLSYYSFKDFDFKNKVSFMVMLGVVVAFMLTSLDPPKVLLAVFALYALHGPILSLLRWRKRRGRAAQNEETIAGESE